MIVARTHVLSCLICHCIRVSLLVKPNTRQHESNIDQDTARGEVGSNHQERLESHHLKKMASYPVIEQ